MSQTSYASRCRVMVLSAVCLEEERLWGKNGYHDKFFIMVSESSGKTVAAVFNPIPRPFFVAAKTLPTHGPPDKWR